MTSITKQLLGPVSGVSILGHLPTYAAAVPGLVQSGLLPPEHSVHEEQDGRYNDLQHGIMEGIPLGAFLASNRLLMYFLPEPRQFKGDLDGFLQELERHLAIFGELARRAREYRDQPATWTQVYDFAGLVPVLNDPLMERFRGGELTGLTEDLLQDCLDVQFPPEVRYLVAYNPREAFTHANQVLGREVPVPTPCESPAES